MDDQHSSVPVDSFADPTKAALAHSGKVSGKTKVHHTGRVDIIAMVRSLQRTAGDTDCFRRGNADCDSIDCDWRSYCLGGASESNPTKRRPKKKR